VDTGAWAIRRDEATRSPFAIPNIDKLIMKVILIVEHRKTMAAYFIDLRSSPGREIMSVPDKF
jgi:hypothetical protein